jgi:hypothetical protein
MTFGNLDDPDSEVSVLIRERKGFTLQPEYGTEPSVYYVDGKIGGKESNIAPENARTGSYIQYLSTVDIESKKRIDGLAEE